MNLNEIEIPEEITLTLYTVVCTHSNYDWRLGHVSTSEENLEKIYSDDRDHSYKLLHQQDVTLKLGKIDFDLNGEIIKGLEAQKTQELAEHHVKITAIQDKIDSMLAIEYQGE